MWIVYAVGSSFFAGITSILAKCGIRETDSNVATAIRTVVVLIFSWLMVFLTDAWAGIGQNHREDHAVSYTVRACYRGILALLFPRPADRGYQ